MNGSCFHRGRRRDEISRSAFKVCLALFLLNTAPLHAQSPATTNLPPEPWNRGIRVHDPSTIVQCGDTFWVFHTGAGVLSHYSSDLVHWQSGPPVFTNAPAWAAEAVPQNRSRQYWAPDIINLNGRWLLYYSISTWGKNNSAIGLVENATLDPANPKFHWVDRGIVVQSTNSDNFNTIDPSVTRDLDGNLWLAFGSFWSGIKLIQLDAGTGKRIATNSPMYSLAANDSIEASCIYPHDKFYYLFVNWGKCCRGTNSTYEIRMGRSPKITGPYLDMDGKDMVEGDGSLFLGTSGSFIGPGHAGFLSAGGTNWFSCHFYDGHRYGAPTLAIFPLRWQSNGWPTVDGPMQK